MLQGITGSPPAGSPSQAESDGAQLENDLDRFLTLLVTQLQHQDPLDPLDANEFTNQLVQFANVEQQIYQNANLEEIVQLQRDSQVAAMVSYIGSTIETSGNALPLENGEATASYTLGEAAADAAIAIIDELGDVVLMTSANTAPGRHLFEWDGLDNQGNAVPDGTYRIQVNAKRSDGSPIDAATTTFGRVTGASADGDERSLYMGEISVPMENVLSVKETRNQTI